MRVSSMPRIMVRNALLAPGVLVGSTTALNSTVGGVGALQSQWTSSHTLHAPLVADQRRRRHRELAPVLERAEARDALGDPGELREDRTTVVAEVDLAVLAGRERVTDGVVGRGRRHVTLKLRPVKGKQQPSQSSVAKTHVMAASTPCTGTSVPRTTVNKALTPRTWLVGPRFPSSRHRNLGYALYSIV